MKEKQQYKTLLAKSREMFMKYGLKSLTMDDIARALGMSKKTIYQFVENKGELIKLTLLDYLEEERKQLDAFLKQSNNSVDELIQMYQYFLAVTHEFNSATINDMQAYYPDSWDVYNEYRFNFFLKRINANLETGVKQGFYRKELKTDIVSRFFVLGFEMLLNQKLFPQGEFVFVEIYREFLDYHLRGIVSEKGLKYLEQHNLFKA
ncbi:MAG TPA: TetR/AcrR family transcriptional regulator [Chitinophagales bacterium]|nr:TetR/AcrR family transcriptional regulator [Chitinophagales bacterium]